MPAQPSALKRAYYRWRSLRLPWRKTWLVGFDLAGNTFWEFKDALNANRLRRIVKYTHSVHLSDVKLAPQWIQWLRHTRAEPPSVQEQRLDMTRQAQMKMLAARADARWAAKPSALDRGAERQTQSQALPLPGQAEHQAQVVAATEAGEGAVPGGRQDEQEAAKSGGGGDGSPEEKPRKMAKDFTGYRLGKEGEQQPGSWAPRPARRRS